MASLPLAIYIDDSEVEGSLEGRREDLLAAVEGAIGELGQDLYDLVEAKLSGLVLQRGSGALADAVNLEAAHFVGDVCMTSVGIDDDDPMYVIGYVHEYGGSKWYDIYPLEAVLGFYSDAGIGAGIKSPFSSPEMEPFKGSRLPHVLAFVMGGATVFAKHVWHPPAQERSYLRSSLDDMEQKAVAKLQAAIDGVLAG